MSSAAAGQVSVRETVLLVDDEQAVRVVAERILSRAGYRVLCAANAAQAILVADGCAEPIHLLLTDLYMPGLKGTELARRLAAARPQLRVLIMSGYAEESLAEATAGRCWHFLEKPFSPEALLLKLRQIAGSEAAA